MRMEVAMKVSATCKYCTRLMIHTNVDNPVVCIVDEEGLLRFVHKDCVTGSSFQYFGVYQP